MVAQRRGRRGSLEKEAGHQVMQVLVGHVLFHGSTEASDMIRCVCIEGSVLLCERNGLEEIGEGEGR